MILIDVNLLLYAYDRESLHHAKARGWLEGVLSDSEPCRISWGGVLGFLRISSSLRGGRRILQIDEALDVVDSWLASPHVEVLEPGSRYWKILKGLLASTHAQGPLVMDVELAALAIEHGANLHSADRDFERIPGLRFTNPLR